jgi:hypothetical protein
LLVRASPGNLAGIMIGIATSLPSSRHRAGAPVLLTLTAAVGLAAVALAAGCDRGPKPSEAAQSSSAAPAPQPAAKAAKSHGSEANPHAKNPHATGNPHAGGATGANPHAGGATGSLDEPPKAGGLTWDAPEVFDRQVPKMRMRAAEYSFSAGGGNATLKVYYFGPGQGGSVDANVDRWVGQFKTEDGKPAKDAAEIEESHVSGLELTMVDVTGTYQGMQMPGRPPAQAKSEQRMLGAIVEGPQGPVFFKMVGPKSTLDEAEAPFEALVQSIHPVG